MHAASGPVRGPNHTTDCQWVRTLPLQEADRLPGASLVEAKNFVNRGGAQLLVDPRDAQHWPTRRGISAVLAGSSHSRLITPFLSIRSATSDTDGTTKAFQALHCNSEVHLAKPLHKATAPPVSPRVYNVDIFVGGNNHPSSTQYPAE